MKIGIIVATKAEREPFYEVFGPPVNHYDEDKGYEVERWTVDCMVDAFLIQSGFGEIAAASSTQYLIDKFQVGSIINYGVVGGLRDSCAVGKVGFVKEAVHYGFDVSATGRYVLGEYPGKGVYLRPHKDAIPKAVMDYWGLSEFTCASADKFVKPGESKKKLYKEFGADICEMEAAGIIITCNRNGIPVSLIKAVSDGVNEGFEAFDQNVHVAALRCISFIYNVIS